jgi:hypothetical protein
MSNKRITDLTELTTPTTDDVFPIVDIATNTTQKVQVGNLPIQTAVTTALATKQETLVSASNIKTINGTSVLGSGNIVTPQPSGVAGAIQFSTGSAFSSDASNLYWDDTNNRLGVGTNAPSATGHFKGSGSTSATTSLLVQNSAGNRVLSTHDDLTTYSRNLRITGENTLNNFGFEMYSTGAGLGHIRDESNRAFINIGERIQVGQSQVQLVSSNSSIFEVASTTKGFLPPRMTTTQINAIASPANGLEVYNTTLAQPCFYDGVAWRKVTHSTM